MHQESVLQVHQYAGSGYQTNSEIDVWEILNRKRTQQVTREQCGDGRGTENSLFGRKDKTAKKEKEPQGL